ncbi:L-aspartate oxidase [Nocardioides bruguierae]|uniref:L-aspartate oxidase n=1 Tax=Nocardioides bruguierae TaxID=2945102 RepID=A0A9X2IGG1_9ACTN|nr:L-aspartate oxidase [Nocardioides bruguierae]MCM0621534.1 L-aspartate oxidase [Nocardioides bruguierae]
MSTPAARLPSRTVPGRLAAPEPGWTERADVVVVGSGVAGLTAALRLVEALGPDADVVVVTKDRISVGSTRWAQGGVAAALGPGDTPHEHEVDTLVAGDGACDAEAVRVLVEEGPEAVRELIGLGAQFDLDPEGELSLTREGGHHRDRIIHAGGDATGAEIQRALVAAVGRNPQIRIVKRAHVLDLALAEDGGVAGLTLHEMGQGQHDGVGLVRAPAVVLASGGLGQVFSQTTNPSVSTGDGMAIALRAGATLRDLEFVQFHPTVMYLGPLAAGQQPLISEAVRGEGAFLVDGLESEGGTRFMTGVHELADLAPRDVVAKAIRRRMIETGMPHMWLDARHLGTDRGEDPEAFWQRRFPTILATCRSHGVDPVTDLIPVAPACHYASGGVATDTWGRTDVPGLYATGEVACSGVHGANRLASNSLLEGLVFSRRIADVLPGELRGWAEPVEDARTAGLVAAEARHGLQEVMTDQVGVLRHAAGLAIADQVLAQMHGATDEEPYLDSWEVTNLATLSTALTGAATLRQETRGSHWREDHPDRDDAAWAGHVDVRLLDGEMSWTFSPAGATDQDVDATADTTTDTTADTDGEGAA